MKVTHPATDGPLALVSLLLFLQGGIAVALAAEAVGAALLFGGGPAFGAVLTVAGATFTMILVARLPLRRRSTRRWILALQFGWLFFALIDAGLAMALAGRGPTPSGFLIRVALPAAIVWLMRRPAVRDEFGAGRSRPDHVADAKTVDRVVEGAGL